MRERERESMLCVCVCVCVGVALFIQHAKLYYIVISSQSGYIIFFHITL